MGYKVGDVVLFNSTKSFFTKMIRKYNIDNYGKSNCTHVGIISKVEKDRILIHETVNLKEGFSSYWYEKSFLDTNKKEKIISIARPKVRVTHVFNNAENYKGIKYGILDILSIVLYWAFKIKLSLTKSNALICSEGVVRVLYDSSNKKIDFEKEYNKPYDLITPMDIYLSKQLLLVFH